jgi:hypothetical protein
MVSGAQAVDSMFYVYSMLYVCVICVLVAVPRSALEVL